MSGTIKKVTDVAFKASKNIDWDGMAKLLVSDEARKEFSSLRRAFEEVNSALQTKFSQVPKIPISFSLFFLSSYVLLCKISLLLRFCLAWMFLILIVFILGIFVLVFNLVFISCKSGLIFISVD